jgi:dihydrolipoamide dehydrogenase
MTNAEAQPMQDMDVDVAVIGAGTAGMAAYRAAARRTSKVVLIEAGAYGTTCARVGCMPSKLLIAAADAAHHAREAEPFGVRAKVEIDGRAVMDRVRRERDRFVGFVLDAVEAFPEEHLLRGRARLVEPGELAVGPVRVKAKAIVVATGGAPWVPPEFEAIRDRLVVNDDVFGWEDLPSSVVVFGAGIIGLELGQALHRLGVRVHVFGRNDSVGPLRDPVVRETARAIFGAELPVEFSADVRLIAPDPQSSGVMVDFIDREGTPRTEKFAVALVATGRRPNLAGLGLEVVGLGPDVAVDRTTMQWGESHVFFAGDVTDDVPLLHEAADEGAIAGESAAECALVGAPRPGSRRSGLAIAFSDPAMAIVGGGWEAASKGRFIAGQVDFGAQGRSRIILQNRGVARLYADPVTRRFLGAELVGPRAEHLAHLLAWAHQAAMTVDQMLAMPFYHPVVEEGIRTALRDVVARLDGKRVEPDAS